jgi:hypothetical protein
LLLVEGQASAIIKLSQPVDISSLELAHVAADDLPQYELLSLLAVLVI